MDSRTPIKLRRIAKNLLLRWTFVAKSKSKILFKQFVRPRNGMFGQFTPLVVGDDSRNYQTVRKLQTIIQRNL